MTASTSSSKQDSNMLIIHVLPRLEFGGTEKTVTDLVISRQMQQVANHMIVTLKRDDGPNRKALVQSGVPIFDLEIYKIFSVAIRFFSFIRTIRAKRTCIIIGWLYFGNIFATLIKLCLPKEHRDSTKLVHNIRNSGIKLRRYGILTFFSYWLNALISPIATSTIYNSAAGLKSHEKRGFNSSRSVVLHNGTDVTKFTPRRDFGYRLRSEWDMPQDALIVLSMGRNDPQKRYDLVYDLAAQNPDVVFILCGENVQKFSATTNFLPLAFQERPEDIYPIADIILSTSTFGEGFQNSVAEGMACGLIPICTVSGDIQDLLGDAGFIVEPASLNGLQKALDEVMEMTKHTRLQRGILARNRIINKFNKHIFHKSFCKNLNIGQD
jgi:glycosyltransferase involved in cell wall biosynthesis